MTQKEFKKLEFGDKVLLHGGLSGKILLFAKLYRNNWRPRKKSDSPDGIYFLPQRLGQSEVDLNVDEAFYIHRAGIRSKI